MFDKFIARGIRNTMAHRGVGFHAARMHNVMTSCAVGAICLVGLLFSGATHPLVGGLLAVGVLRFFGAALLYYRAEEPGEG